MKADSSQFDLHEFENGLTLIGDYMDSVSSAAVSILLPVGVVGDPRNRQGVSSILSEMLVKGAGPWDTKELSQRLDDLGAQRAQSSGIEVTVLSGAVLANNLESLLSIVSKMLLEPHLPEADLESVRNLAVQEIKSLDDRPGSKVLSELAKNFYPDPFGRSPLGTLDGVSNVTIEDVRAHHRQHYLAGGSVIAIAGKYDWEAVKSAVSKHFGKWSGASELADVPQLDRESRVYHLSRDTAQTQLAFAYPSVTHIHPDYYVSLVAVGLLSGGMAGRLFVEVREKRGLVYRVSASHSAARGRAAIFTIAGTTPDRADETVSVILTELRNLKDNLTEIELGRAKADLKSRLIIQRELSSMRASALVNDWWNIGRLRTLEEIKAAIDAVQIDDIVRHVTEFPPEPITMQTLGPRAVELPQ